MPIARNGRARCARQRIHVFFGQGPIKKVYVFQQVIHLIGFWYDWNAHLRLPLERDLRPRFTVTFSYSGDKRAIQQFFRPAWAAERGERFVLAGLRATTG